jgi:penicillin amidase
VDLDTASYAVSGPWAPVEILIDRWGVSHVYASSPYDAFFAQGWCAARDRLWQIDLWRRRGLGLLSEVFGPSFVEQDRAARLFLYRGRCALSGWPTARIPSGWRRRSSRA